MTFFQGTNSQKFMNGILTEKNVDKFIPMEKIFLYLIDLKLLNR